MVKILEGHFSMSDREKIIIIISKVVGRKVEL
jgi:hypothetical protein